MGAELMSVAACERTHEAIDKKFADVDKNLEREREERMQSVNELKEEFKTTNTKIDTAVDEIKNQWFKNLFIMLRWAMMTILAMGGFIVYHYAVGNFKIPHP